jgi:hypothetical protein
MLSPNEKLLVCATEATKIWEKVEKLLPLLNKIISETPLSHDEMAEFCSLRAELSSIPPVKSIWFKTDIENGASAKHAERQRRYRHNKKKVQTIEPSGSKNFTIDRSNTLLISSICMKWKEAGGYGEYFDENGEEILTSVEAFPPEERDAELFQILVHKHSQRQREWILRMEK